MLAVIVLAVPAIFLLTALFSQRRRTRLLADPATHPGLLRLDRTTLAARWAGLVAGLLGAGVLAGAQPHGRGLLLAPAAVAVGLAAAHVVAELVAWRSARSPGVASLETREPWRYLPRGALTVLGAALAVLAALLVWCRSRQNTEPDEVGTVGRQFTWRSADGLSGGGSGPFPGSYYSFPLAVVLAVMLLLAAVGLLLVLHRPRNGADPVVVAVDDQVRARTAEALAATCVVGVAGSLVPAALLAGFAVLHRSVLAGGALLALCFVSLAVLAWALAALLVPGRGERLS